MVLSPSLSLSHSLSLSAPVTPRKEIIGNGLELKGGVVALCFGKESQGDGWSGKSGLDLLYTYREIQLRKIR